MTHKITLNQDADNEINIRIFSEKADGHVHLNIGDNIVCFEFSAEINPFYDHNDDVVYQGDVSDLQIVLIEAFTNTDIQEDVEIILTDELEQQVKAFIKELVQEADFDFTAQLEEQKEYVA